MVIDDEKDDLGQRKKINANKIMETQNAEPRFFDQFWTTKGEKFRLLSIFCFVFSPVHQRVVNCFEHK